MFTTVDSLARGCSVVLKKSVVVDDETRERKKAYSRKHPPNYIRSETATRGIISAMTYKRDGRSILARGRHGKPSIASWMRFSSTKSSLAALSGCSDDDVGTGLA